MRFDKHPRWDPATAEGDPLRRQFSVVIAPFGEPTARNSWRLLNRAAHAFRVALALGRACSFCRSRRPYRIGRAAPIESTGASN
jgi:hypothetical protein